MSTANALTIAEPLCRASGLVPPTSRTSVHCRGRSIAYDSLAGEAARYRDLVNACAPDGAAVAICAEKTAATVAAIAGILMSDRPYAPLDPAHPTARLENLLDALRPGALICDEAGLRRLGGAARRARLAIIAIGGAGPGYSLAALKSARFRTPRPLAAILHTSGSTGTPKQVLISAEAIRVFAEWVTSEFALGPEDCVLSHAPFAFDLSFLDLFASLHSGASIALADAGAAANGARLIALLEEAGVTFWHSAPSALGLVAAAAGDRVFEAVRCVLFAGEPIADDLLQRLFAIFPNARLVNIYGCTETNDTFFFDVPRTDPPVPLPLGRPIDGVDFAILGEDRMPVPEGASGELAVHCPTMMERYGDERQTRKAIRSIGGRRYYLTGDRVRRDAAGLLHFLGRADSVVKLNGFRLDMAEIERVLHAHDGVREVAVFVTEDDGAKTLCASVSAPTEQLTGIDLRRHAMRVLPAHAIPRRFTFSAAPLPKNTNGKICRKTLARARLQA